jgi:hypothetical protein
LVTGYSWSGTECEAGVEKEAEGENGDGERLGLGVEGWALGPERGW